MYKCINLIKISIQNNKKGFLIINNKKNLNVIKAFMKLNVIKAVTIKNNKLFVFINYFNNKPVFRNILNMHKPGNKIYITYKNISKISNKHNWIILLSTSKGIITNLDALRLKIGGLIIAKIWN